MQEAGWISGDRFGEFGGAEGRFALGEKLLRWAKAAAAMHVLESAYLKESRGCCAETGEGVTVEERVALLDASDRAIRARVKRMVFGAVR